MKKIILGGVVLIGGLLLLSGCGTSNVVLDNNAIQGLQSNVVSVTGKGEVSVKPDTAFIYANVVVEKTDAKEAQSAANAIVEEIMKGLDSVGVNKDDVSTSNYNVDMIRDYNTPVTHALNSKTDLPNPILGYRVSNQIKVTVKKVDEAGKVIDAISQKENVTIDSLQFGLLDNEAAKNEAIKKATEQAKRQAESVASTIGSQIKGIKNIQVDASNYSNDYRSYGVSSSYSVADSVATNVSVGDLTVSASVQAQFELKK